MAPPTSATPHTDQIDAHTADRRVRTPIDTHHARLTGPAGGHINPLSTTTRAYSLK